MYLIKEYIIKQHIKNKLVERAKWNLKMNVINMYNISGTPDNIISLKLVLGYVWYVKCVLLVIVTLITNST